MFEDDAAAAEAARRGGAEVVAGNAADPEVLRAANLPAARRLVVTIPEAFEAGQVVEQARAANPGLASSRAPTPTPRSPTCRAWAPT